MMKLPKVYGTVCQKQVQLSKQIFFPKKLPVKKKVVIRDDITGETFPPTKPQLKPFYI